jgi:hypothetical protein
MDVSSLLRLVNPVIISWGCPSLKTATVQRPNRICSELWNRSANKGYDTEFFVDKDGLVTEIG